MMIRLGILGSTRGTNMQAIIDAMNAKQLAASIEIVISNKSDALILERAAVNQLPHHFVNSAGLDRETYDEECFCALHQYRVDLIVLIG